MNNISKITDIGCLEGRRLVAVYFSDMSLPDDKGFSFILSPLLPQTIVHGQLIYEFSCVKVARGLRHEWEEIGLYLECHVVPKNLILLDNRRPVAPSVANL